MKRLLKILFRLKYQHWSPCDQFEDGYAMLVPSPMDMPFLLRFTLEGLRFMDTTRCRQILIIPDGWGDDRGAALQNVMSEFKDPRLKLLHMTNADRMIVRRLPSPHWLTIIYGINEARTRHAFLHDADAFFVEPDGMERIYQSALDHPYDAVGVTARWDPFFTKIDYQIPGTWEMVFSCPWIRGWKPFHVRGQRYDTPHGEYAFDTLLYPQYHDYSQGRVGVMKNPPALLHFNGSIVTYRAWQRLRSTGRPVTDELYRLLLLALMETLVPSSDGNRLLPTISSLAEGLSSDTAPVQYVRDRKRPYLEFRNQLEQLFHSPVFVGERGKQLGQLISPFDEFYAKVPLEPESDKKNANRLRKNGLA